MYTVTPAYFSNSSLQYSAIFRLRFSSLRPFACAPACVLSCPGSNTTTIFFCALYNEYADTVAGISITALSIADSMDASEVWFPFSSNVTTSISTPAASMPSSTTTASGSASTSFSTPNFASIPASAKYSVYSVPSTITDIAFKQYAPAP